MKELEEPPECQEKESLRPLPLLHKIKPKSPTCKYCHKAEICERSIQDENLTSGRKGNTDVTEILARLPCN